MGNTSSSAVPASEMRENIAATAERNVGDDRWAYEKPKDNFPENSHKCNKFVYDVLKETNASPPTGPFGRWPIVVKDWVEGDHTRDGWHNMGSNVKWQRGDVIAVKKDYQDATGHCAIAVSETEAVGVSASTGKVRKGDHGFGDDAKVIRYKPEK